MIAAQQHRGAPPPLETLRQAIDRVRLLPPNTPEQARTASLMGIVTECSLPRPSRGSGALMCSLVVDVFPSCCMRQVYALFGCAKNCLWVLIRSE
jgi:hypothetical protein